MSISDRSSVFARLSRYFSAWMKRDSNGKYPMPSLYDISDSAHWANKPDVGIIVNRPDLAVNETVIKVAKARYHAIGISGEIKGIWNESASRYTITNDGSTP